MPSPPQPPPQPYEALSKHDQFRALASLVALVASMNNVPSEDPRLSSTTDGGDTPTDRYGRVRNPRTSSSRRALNAMAILLVRDGDVIACTAPPGYMNEVNVIAVQESQKPQELQELPMEMLPLVGASRDFHATSSEHGDAAKDLKTTRSETEDAAEAEGNGPEQCLPPISFTTLANPPHTKASSDSFEWDIKKRAPSQALGYWRKCVENRWAALEIAGGSSLADHAATLESYLGAYQKESNMSKRGEYFETFLSYTITVCMPKIFRRMNLPFSQVLMEALSTIPRETLVEMKENLVSDKKATNVYDQYLSSSLNEVSRLVREDPHNVTAVVPDDIKELSISALAEALQGRDEASVAIYNGSTYLEFHDLLVTTIRGFNKALQVLKKSKSASPKAKGPPQDNIKRDAIQNAQLYGYLLWQISGSTVLSAHLKSLDHANAIDLAKVEEKTKEITIQRDKERWNKVEEDQERAKQKRDKKLATQTKGKGKEVVVDEEQKVKDKEQKVTDEEQKVMDEEQQMVDEASTMNEDEEQQVTDEEPSMMDEERKMVDEASAMNEELPGLRVPEAEIIPKVLSGWIRLLIEHFASVFYLSSYVKGRIKRPVKIHPLAVNGSSTGIATPWSSVLKSVLADGSPQLTFAKSIISQHIGAKMKNASAQYYWLKGPTCFNQEVMILQQSTLHCEAVLAAMIMHSSLAKSSGDIDWTRQTEIGVSKLCCPVCTELLSLFDESRELETQFNVRGSHSVMTFTELPSWLPPDVIDSMLTRFGVILSTELRILLVNAANVIPRTASHQRTVSGVSLQSRASTDYSEFSQEGKSEIQDVLLRTMAPPVDGQHAGDTDDNNITLV